MKLTLRIPASLVAEIEIVIEPSVVKPAGGSAAERAPLGNDRAGSSAAIPLEGGPSRAAADCRASPKPAAQAVNADPSSGRVSPDESTSQGSEVGNEAEVARVVPPPSVLDEPSVVAIREARVEVAPSLNGAADACNGDPGTNPAETTLKTGAEPSVSASDIPTVMETIGNRVRAAIENPPPPEVDLPAELPLRRPVEEDDLAIPPFLRRSAA